MTESNFVKSQIAKYEKIVCKSEGIWYKFSDARQEFFSRYIFRNQSQPPEAGTLILTSHRLVIINSSTNYGYSTTAILGVSERLAGVKSQWPYQATIFLPAGLIVTVENPKVIQSPLNLNDLPNLIKNAAIALSAGSQLDGIPSSLLTAIEDDLQRENDSQQYNRDKDNNSSPKT